MPDRARESGLLGRALGLYRLARTPREALSVTRFNVKYMAWGALPHRWRTLDTQLRVGRVEYTMAVRGRESFVLHELYLDRIYEKVPGFAAEQGWTVFDLGANAGVFSVQQALRGARVFSFEPNPDCYRRLARTLDRNGLTARVTAFNQAVAGAPGRLPFLVGSSTLGGRLQSALEPGDTPRREVATVEVTSLDRAVERCGVDHIDLLKIDVEGSEVEVLEGGGRALALADRVVLEYHSQELLDEVDARLAAKGFRRLLRDETAPHERRGNAYYARVPPGRDAA